MWVTDSLWFEVAIVSIIYAVGNMAFGHFEERTPIWRRIGKYVLTMVIIILLSVYFGRGVAMSVLGAFIFPFLYIHGYYLPIKKGIMVGPVSQRLSITSFAAGTKTFLIRSDKRDEYYT